MVEVSRNDRSYWKRALLALQKLDAMPWALRKWLLNNAGADLSSSAFFEAGVDIVTGPLRVREDAYINRGCFLDARGGISVGRNTLIGPQVTILTATHPIMPEGPRAGPVQYEPVVIGDGVWIGARSVLLPGTVVEDGCVIGAGSIVRGMLLADHLYAGVPAKVIRFLNRDDKAEVRTAA